MSDSNLFKPVRQPATAVDPMGPQWIVISCASRRALVTELDQPVQPGDLALLCKELKPACGTCGVNWTDEMQAFAGAVCEVVTPAPDGSDLIEVRLPGQQAIRAVPTYCIQLCIRLV